MNWKNCVVLLSCFVVVLSVKLPNYFKKCSLSDPNVGDCIKQSGNGGLPTFLEGDKSIRVVNLKPLVVPKIHLDVGKNLKINLTDSSIYGLETASIDESRWDAKNRRLDSIVSLDHTHFIGTYDIAGRILILPINGHGPCNITFVKPIFKYFNEFEIKKKNNKKYYEIVKHGLSYETERAYFHLDNLFNGDPRLGPEMNRFLNENWVEVNKELGARVGDAMSEIFSGIIQEIYNRVPENELFDN